MVCRKTRRWSLAAKVTRQKLCNGSRSVGHTHDPCCGRVSPLQISRPTLPTHMAVEEKSVKKHLKSMKKELESSAAHEDAIDVAEKKLQTYITDELNTLSNDVHKVNIQDTDNIDNVEPTVGAPGPPGYHGTNGRNGMMGLHGPTGVQGRPGPRGGAGKMGPPGVVGDQGPIGHEGPGGFAGTCSGLAVCAC